MSERWYWLDWLRVLAMGTIFLYHSGRPFMIDDSWHIMNPEPDLLFTIVIVFVSGWIMPLFFVISGMATCFSLAKRSPAQFANDRFKRLMIPFLLPGLLVILPVHVYYDKIFHGSFAGGFANFYLGPYFTNEYFPFDTDFSPTYLANSNQGVYLWYVFWLFVFSLVTVHFFKWLMKEGNRSRISKLGTACNRRGGMFLLAISIIIVNIAAVPPFFVFPSGYGGWKLPTYLAIFITAYVLACDPKFEESIHKNRTVTLLMGTILSLSQIILLGTVGAEALLSPHPLTYVTVSAVYALNAWCWVIAILGYGRKLLSFNHRFLEISNERVAVLYSPPDCNRGDRVLCCRVESDGDRKVSHHSPGFVRYDMRSTVSCQTNQSAQILVWNEAEEGIEMSRTVVVSLVLSVWVAPTASRW